MIIIKICAAAMVASCGGILGQAFINAEKQKLAVIKSLSLSLMAVADEICACKTPLPQIISRLAQKQTPSTYFFEQVLCKLKTETFSNSWLMACDSLQIGESECEIMKAVVSGFGKVDAEAQAACFSGASHALSSCSAVREEKMRNERKIAPTLGMALGAMCAIVLL